MPLLKKQGSNEFTYREYLKWPDDERWEIIEGEAYGMSPAPSRMHQEISMKLVNKIYNYLGGKVCKVFAAPFDVRLSYTQDDDENIKSVVQPDISVICDENKLDDKGAKGAPDFIIEIVSPSSTFLDYVIKLNLYGKYSVKEYWIVNPVKKNVLVYILDENKEYGTPEMYNEGEKIKVSIFQDLTIDLAYIFE